MKKHSCLVCQSKEYETVYTLREDPYLRRLGLQTTPVSKVLCRECGLIYSQPQLEESELKQLYASLRQSDMPAEEHLWWKERQAQEDFEWVRPYLGARGSVLDIGCSEGSFLRMFQKHGWQPCGIEPSSFGRFGRARYGLDVREGLFEEIDLDEHSFDLVAALRVLEHIANPREFLSRIDSLLKQEGLLYLEVPNVWNPRHHLREFLGAQHLRLFSKETLLLFLAQMGFEPVAVDDSKRSLRVLFKRSQKESLLLECPPPRRRLEAHQLRRVWQGYRLKYFWGVTLKGRLRQGMDRILGPTLARGSVREAKRLFRALVGSRVRKHSP